MNSLSKVIISGPRTAGKTTLLHLLDGENNLVNYNNRGGFISKIGNVGRGPGEYPSIENFALLSTDNLIAIHSMYLRKALIYNYNGVLKKSFDLIFYPDNNCKVT